MPDGSAICCVVGLIIMLRAAVVTTLSLQTFPICFQYRVDSIWCSLYLLQDTTVPRCRTIG